MHTGGYGHGNKLSMVPQGSQSLIIFDSRVATARQSFTRLRLPRFLNRAFPSVRHPNRPTAVSATTNLLAANHEADGTPLLTHLSKGRQAILYPCFGTKHSWRVGVGEKGRRGLIQSQTNPYNWKEDMAGEEMEKILSFSTLYAIVWMRKGQMGMRKSSW